MPADFMEELNKEKQNLLNSENSSGINEQIASSLQNVIDKANASSESYEILERVVNSFNHAGKNLRDNIGEIISTFNALNNSVKTNTSSASSLKKVYSENFFSGTVRGADNLINKLNEIQENISSIKSFGNIFEESVIGGNNLLNTINEIKSSLAEISSFNISSDIKIGNLPRFQSGGMVTGGSKTGDKILARLNAGEWVLTEQQMNNVAKMLSHNSGKKYTADQIFSMTGGKKGIDYDNSGTPMFAKGGSLVGIKSHEKELKIVIETKIKNIEDKQEKAIERIKNSNYSEEEKGKRIEKVKDYYSDDLLDLNNLNNTLDNLPKNMRLVLEKNVKKYQSDLGGIEVSQLFKHSSVVNDLINNLYSFYEKMNKKSEDELIKIYETTKNTTGLDTKDGKSLNVLMDILNEGKGENIPIEIYKEIADGNELSFKKIYELLKNFFDSREGKVYAQEKGINPNYYVSEKEKSKETVKELRNNIEDELSKIQIEKQDKLNKSKKESSRIKIIEKYDKKENEIREKQKEFESLSHSQQEQLAQTINEKIEKIIEKEETTIEELKKSGEYEKIVANEMKKKKKVLITEAKTELNNRTRELKKSETVSNDPKKKEQLNEERKYAIILKDLIKKDNNVAIKVGAIKNKNGELTNESIKRIIKEALKESPEKANEYSKKLGLKESDLTGKENKYSETFKNITVFGTLIQETTSKLANFANQINEFGLKYANLRVELARQSTGGSDILAGQTVQGWGDKFDLTREQSTQLFPAIEEFVRNSNVDMSSIDTIAENLKQSTGVLRPEDLKQALNALQGMTQGQIDYVTGKGASTSDRYGVAFSLLENPSQLDAMIKAQASGAFTGETPEGLESGDKSLLDNNQKMLSTVDAINNSLSKHIPSFTPWASKIFSTVSKIIGVLLMQAAFSQNLPKIFGKGGIIRNSRAIMKRGIGKSALNLGKGLFGKTTPIIGKIVPALGKITPIIGKIVPLISKIIPFGAKLLGGLGKLIPGIGWAVAAITALTSVVSGWKNAEEITGKKKENITYGDKFTSVRASLASAATLNFISSRTMFKFLDSDIGKFFDITNPISLPMNLLLKATGVRDKKVDENKHKEKTPEEKREEMKLESLQSFKTYQTFIKQIKSGQYTKFEDYMTRFFDSNLRSLSLQGGTDAAFKVFSGNKAEFATASFGKSMQLINEKIRNVTKGLNAIGTGSIYGAEQIAAYAGLIEQQISITEKWIKSIESSIGRYAEIPSVILNEMKNKISQFSFGTYAIGGGTVSGGRKEISSIISRTNSNIEAAFDQFSSDLQKVSEADAVYKNLQQQKLNNANSVLGTSYTMEDLKDKNTTGKLADRAKTLDFNIMAQLEKKGISRTDYEAYRNSQNISKFKASDAENWIGWTSDEGQKKAKDMFEKLSDYVNAFGNKDQKLMVKDFQGTIDNEGKITQETWNSIAELSKNVYKKNDDKIKKERANDATFEANIDKWQKENISIKELLSVNDGDNLRTKNELKMIEGLNKIFQEIRNSTRQLIEASVNNSNSVFQRNVAQIESLKIGSAKWNSEGIGGNVVRMSNAKTEEIASSVENLRKTRNQMMKEYSKSYSKDLRNIFKNGNAGMSDSDQIELQKYGKKLNERDVLRSKIQSGIATKEERKQEARLSLELEKDSANLSAKAKAKDNGTIEIAKKALERSSAERANAIVEVSKKLEEVKASFIPEFLKTIEHLSNIETFTSLTYKKLAEANKEGMKYLGVMGASRGEIKASGKAALESTLTSGDDSVKKAQNTFAQLNSEKGAREQIEENFRKIKRLNPEYDDKKAMKLAGEMYTGQVSAAGKMAAGGAKNIAMEANNQMTKDIEQALNALSTKRQEGLNIEKAMATMVGAPLQEILRIEKESIKETFLQYKNSEERYKTNLELAKKGKISQEALLESQNNMKKMQQKAYSEILGAQRSVMEQMFGRLVGTFKDQAGFAGASMYSKYGAGLSVNAQGVVTGMGKENLNAHGSYGERILGNQLSALGGGKQVSSEKDEKTVEAIKQMANIHKTTNDLVSKILEKINKEKTEAESKNEKAKNEAEAQKDKDSVTKEFLKGQFDRIPGIKGGNEKEIQKEQPKAMKYDQDLKDKNQQIKAELKREYKGDARLTSEVRDKSKNVDELRGEQLLRKRGIIDPNYYKNLFNKYDSDPELMKKKHEDINVHAMGRSISISNHNDRKAQKAFQHIRNLTTEQIKQINENYMSSKVQTVVAPVQRNVTSNSSQQHNLNSRIASNNAQNQKVQVTVKIDASDQMKQIAKIEPKEIVTKRNIVQANQQANMRQIGQE